MDDALTAAKTVAALRVAVALAWGAIGIWGVPSMLRVIAGRTIRGDYFWASMMMLAVGLLIFQIRSLTGIGPMGTDIYTLTGLVSLFLSAVGIFVTRSLSAPDEHKRAALITHMILVAICFLVGLLT